MKHKIIIGVLLLFFISAASVPLLASTSSEKASAEGFKIPSIVFKGKVLKLEEIGKYDKLYLDGKEITGRLVKIEKTGTIILKISKDNKSNTYSVYSLHGFLTLLPPIFAIALALIFKEVVLSLFIGIFTGAFFLSGFDFVGSFFRVVDKYILEALGDKDRASIIIFTLLLGGMVGILTRSGGFKGIVDKLSTKVTSANSTEFYTWLMGILIFFDDYTNTLIVGNTMRPLSDKWKISREKLAYIVDSTAAPMASIAVVSTWIGFEISLINQSLIAYNVDADAFHLFLSSLPYRFYPLLGLIFVFLTFTLKRDFGPMLRAENRARQGKLMEDKAVPLADFESSGLAPSEYVKARWYNGLIPIVVVIVSTFAGLYLSGKIALLESGNMLGEKSIFSVVFSANVLKNLGDIISAANSFQVLIGASMLGVFTAMCLAGFERILKLKEIIEAFVQGMKSMIMAVVILVLAWSLGVVLVELCTADYLVSLLQSGMNYHMFPAVVFVLSALVAFSTGTSWGTISIMYPLIIPIIIVLTKETPDFSRFLTLTVSSVLAGAVFGDHCSPISDTTIMSSMASSCDHIDHVKTQIPYALLIACISLFIGIIPVSFGFPYIPAIILCIGTSVFFLLYFGKKPIEME
ncbi:MAG: Na+/H+ antiporter NhaC family protein [bacterium]|nr:Na+/H+ antiporter NhaC family protein [bacterium]